MTDGSAHIMGKGVRLADYNVEATVDMEHPYQGGGSVSGNCTRS